MAGAACVISSFALALLPCAASAYDYPSTFFFTSENRSFSFIQTNSVYFAFSVLVTFYQYHFSNLVNVRIYLVLLPSLKIFLTITVMRCHHHPLNPSAWSPTNSLESFSCRRPHPFEARPSLLLPISLFLPSSPDHTGQPGPGTQARHLPL